MLLTVDVATAVEAALQAPSLHNSQPWRFRLHGDSVEVRIDPQRRLSAADPSGWGARIAGGAALFNLRLAVTVQGFRPTVRICPDPRDPDLLAVLGVNQHQPPSPVERRLAEAIWHRHSHRGEFWPDPVPATSRARLVSAARAEQGWLELLIGREPVRAVGELARAADRQLMRDPAYREEVAAWIRRQPTDRPDGVAADHGPADLGSAAGRSHGELPARPYGDRDAGAGTAELHTAEPLIAVVGTPGDSEGDQVRGGEILQRVLLTATDEGLATSMVSQPIEVAPIREQLRLALGQYGTPQMLLRIGYGVPGHRPPRRPVAEVFEGELPDRVDLGESVAAHRS